MEKDKYPRPLQEFEGYKLGKTIGKGSMGKVKLLISQDGFQYACKIIKRPVIDNGPEYLKKYNFMSDFYHQSPRTPQELDDVRAIREMATLLLLDHPYIATVYKLVNGTHVLDFIISHGKLKEKFAQNLFVQLLSAVEYCHLNSIVHRDLKIENILINSKGNIQLIDFGLANLYSNFSYLRTFCGSLYFAAPELLIGKKYIGPEVDIWSLGVILYVLTCGKVPFDDVSLSALNAKIIAGQVEYPSHLSSNIKHLLSIMLVVQPHKRCSITQIKAHPWFAKGTKFNSYLPKREKITSIDPQVTKRMGGFMFGTPEQITEKLVQSLSVPELENEPIVSIYHLVSEKISRSSAIYKNQKPLRIEKPQLRSDTKSKKISTDQSGGHESVFENFKHHIWRSKTHRESPGGHSPSNNEADESPLEEVDMEKNRRFSDLSKAIKGFFINIGHKKDEKSVPESNEEEVRIPETPTSAPVESKAEPLPLPMRINNHEGVGDTILSSSSPHFRSSSFRARHSTLSRKPTFDNQHTEPPDTIGRNRTAGLLTDVIEKVSFAGLFSTQTTSTKHPTQMRELLLEALKTVRKEVQLSFYERKGSLIVLVAGQSSDVAKSNISLSDESLPSLRRVSMSFSEATSNGSLWENDPQAEGDPGVETKKLSTNIAFEICIGKIKMMKLHCIKFHKLEGNSIEYKKICSRILEILAW